MSVERTFSILKPDALEKGIIGKIIGRFEEKGLKSRGGADAHALQKEA